MCKLSIFAHLQILGVLIVDETLKVVKHLSPVGLQPGCIPRCLPSLGCGAPKHFIYKHILFLFSGRADLEMQVRAVVVSGNRIAAGAIRNHQDDDVINVVQVKQLSNVKLQKKLLVTDIYNTLY